MSNKKLPRPSIILLVALAVFALLAGAQLEATSHRTPTTLMSSSGLAAPPDTVGSAPDPGIQGSYPRIEITEDLYVRQVRDGVFVITHSFPWAGNSLIVEMENSDLVLVDTPYTPAATRELLEWAAEQFGQRAIKAINTGYHHDNLGGNSYLVECGIPVHGSRLTARLLTERGDAMRETTLGWLQTPEHRRYHEVHRTLPYVPPTHRFDLKAGLRLEFGEETVQVYYPGPSHAPDNVVVYFVSQRLLFGGCMVVGWDGLGNTADADLEAWPQSVRRLERFHVDLVVPGHGERVDPGLLEHTIELLASETGN